MLREIGCFRDADFGVGGDQILFRGADIRTALQQRGRQTRRAPRAAVPARSARVRGPRLPGFLPKQQADLILGLLDLLLQMWEWSRRLCTPVVRAWRRSSSVATPPPCRVLDQTQRFLARRERASGDLQLIVEFAQG